MGKTTAWGSITIVDRNDVGKLSASLGSSLPLTTIYDPNQSPSYSPNWETTNLVLTPTVYFNDELLALTASGLTFTWQRKAGSGETTGLITGESVRNGVLTVSKNVLSEADLITYICNISYIDPDSNGIEISAKVQMTFSLVRNPKKLSDCNITGDTTFKYNGEGNLISAPTITLNAILTNATLKQWQYKKADDTFAVYPNSTASTTLTVNATDDVFVNDTAIIKLLTNDDNIFKLHQITKLRDGAAGSATITCNLTNDSQSIPCDASGNLYTTSLNGAKTTITVLKGSKDDTSNWNITATASAGITGTYDEKTYTYTITGITVETGYVDFICARSGYTTVTKRFSVHKDRSGSDGKAAGFYSIKTNVGYLKIDKNGIFIPSSVTFSASKTIGDAESVYKGRFKIYESLDSSTFELKYTSDSDESGHEYIPSSNKVKLIKSELYEAGNVTNLKDEQSLVIVNDGEKGQDGDKGKDSLNIVLGNSSDIIHCDTNGNVSEAKDITIPYDCYLGTVRTAGKASVATPLPSGMSVKSNTDATENAGGTIVLSIEQGASLFSSYSGEITITFTSNSLTSTHKFTLTKNIQASDGQNAVLFQIYCPGENVITNNNNDVTLETQLTDGMDLVTNGITYQWSKFIDGNYLDISGCTNNYLVVTPSMVDSVESFRCKATYKNKVFQAFWTVTDKTDPTDVQCFSSLGDQLINGVGLGGVYAMVFRNGEEIDKIKSTEFSIENPTTTTTGYFYKVNEANQSVTLMKYTDGTWKEAPSSDQPTATYEWYRCDKDGNPLDTSKPYKTGKAIFLNESVVNKKVILKCKYIEELEEDTHIYILVDEAQRPVVDESDNSISTIVYE